MIYINRDRRNIRFIECIQFTSIHNRIDEVGYLDELK